ncbi:MAG: hypothetical protein VX095_07495 [Pseudomonadota bacterium]|nr:hypothetical protein [Pseudomonadota bacterium]
MNVMNQKVSQTGFVERGAVISHTRLELAWSMVPGDGPSQWSFTESMRYDLVFLLIMSRSQQVIGNAEVFVAP